MNIGKEILSIRKRKNMSQEEFGQLFHVTRQTVSNWENEKSYPDLQTLIDISDMFDISLDKLLKEDKQMVKSVSKTIKDGIRWKLFIKIVACILIVTLISSVIYAGIWSSSKEKLEAKFNHGIKSNGFEQVDKGYYLLEETDNLTFTLPNQKMPSLFDFSLDFHAKHLDAELKTQNDIICIRWLDLDNIYLYVKWDGSDINRSKSYEIDKTGILLDDAKNIPEEVRKLYEKHQDEIQEILKQGNSIYQSVY